MSIDGTKQFLDAAKRSQWHALFLLAVTTDMRPGEYFALQRKYTSLDHSAVHITRNLARRKGAWHFDEPKTVKSGRGVKIALSVVRVLRAHKSRQAAERLLAGIKYQSLDLVFAAQNGQSLENNRIRNRYFKPLLEKAGLPTAIRLYLTCSKAPSTRWRACCFRFGRERDMHTRRSFAHTPHINANRGWELTPAAPIIMPAI